MFKKLLKRIVYGYKATSDSYVAYLKSVGVDCGDNIRIFCPHDTKIDVLNPHLLSIGSNVAITGPATIITHDYSVFVANHLSGGRLYGKQAATHIGNNVFIGWGVRPSGDCDRRQRYCRSVRGCIWQVGV